MLVIYKSEAVVTFDEGLSQLNVGTIYPVFSWLCCFFFFFQAEDGIRDTSVTGVQTCALPICFPV